MIEEKGMMKRVKWLFWGWLIVVLVLNVVPLGNEINRYLSVKRFIFRLDYVVHSLTFLPFAWIWVFGKIKNVRWFVNYEVLKFMGLYLFRLLGLN